MKKIMCALPGVFVVFAANATVWPVVNTVAEFTNTVAKASNGDRIVLAAGKTFDFSTLSEYAEGTSWGTMGAPSGDANGKSCVWFNKWLEIHGENDSMWNEKTSAQETIVDGGNAARIFYSYAGNGRKTRYENLTFARGVADGGKKGGAILAASTSNLEGKIMNCVFRNCIASDGGGVYNYPVENSFFTNCTATASGGAYAAENTSQTAKGCRFVDNRAKGQDFAHGTPITAGGGAMFKGRAVGCRFMYNVCTNFGGACALTVAETCSFAENRSTNNRGGAMVNGSASDCAFTNNYVVQSGARGGACVGTSCVRCEFVGMGDVSGGSFLNCEFSGVTSNGGSQSWVFDAVRNKGVSVAATNCLVHGCSVRFLVNSEGQNTSFVNCTFADNTLADDGYSARCTTGAASGTSYNSTAEFINCLFAGNAYAAGNKADLAVSIADGCSMAFVNCAYEDGMSGVTGATIVSLRQGRARFAGLDPRFIAKAPYYTPCHSSVARNAGLNMDWMTVVVDLAGNGRINGDTVDVGCYESYLPAMGFVLSVR